MNATMKLNELPFDSMDASKVIELWNSAMLGDHCGDVYESFELHLGLLGLKVNQCEQDTHQYSLSTFPALYTVTYADGSEEVMCVFCAEKRVYGEDVDY